LDGSISREMSKQRAQKETKYDSGRLQFWKLSSFYSFILLINKLWTNLDVSNSKEYVRGSARLNEKQSYIVFPNIHGQLDKCMSRF